MSKPTEAQIEKASRIATGHSLTLCLAAIGRREGDISLAKQMLADDVARALANAYAAGRRAAVTEARAREGGGDA